jgi:hypothetical protein
MLLKYTYINIKALIFIDKTGPLYNMYTVFIYQLSLVLNSSDGPSTTKIYKFIV